MLPRAILANQSSCRSANAQQTKLPINYTKSKSSCPLLSVKLPTLCKMAGTIKHKLNLLIGNTLRIYRVRVYLMVKVILSYPMIMEYSSNIDQLIVLGMGMTLVQMSTLMLNPTPQILTRNPNPFQEPRPTLKNMQARCIIVFFRCTLHQKPWMN